MNKRELINSLLDVLVESDLTNGDMIKLLFPREEIFRSESDAGTFHDLGTIATFYDSWWNSPYGEKQVITKYDIEIKFKSICGGTDVYYDCSVQCLPNEDDKQFFCFRTRQNEIHCIDKESIEKLTLKPCGGDN